MTVLIKMNVLSNLSDSEFSIGHGFVKVHDAAWAELVFAINSNENQLKSKREHARFHKISRFIIHLPASPFTCLC